MPTPPVAPWTSTVSPGLRAGALKERAIRGAVRHAERRALRRTTRARAADAAATATQTAQLRVGAGAARRVLPTPAM